MKTLRELNSDRKNVTNQVHWSRLPGEFLDPASGEVLNEVQVSPVSIREWYETLVLAVEKVIESSPVSDDNYSLYVSPDCKTILEHTLMWMPAMRTEQTSRLMGDVYTLEGQVGPYRVYCNAYHATSLIDVVLESTCETVGVVKVKFS